MAPATIMTNDISDSFRGLSISESPHKASDRTLKLQEVPTKRVDIEDACQIHLIPIELANELCVPLDHLQETQ